MTDLATKIKVMQAALDGEEIEYIYNGCDWITHSGEPAFNWVDSDYRIKPEPIEFWVNVYENFYYGAFKYKDNAEFDADGNPTFIKTIKVREVME